MAIPKSAVESILIVAGSLINAFGIVAFLLPHKVAAGGPPGLAVLITEIIDVSPGMVILSISSTLMLLGLKYLGRTFLIRTLIAVVLTSLMTDGLLFWLEGLIISNDRFLNALYAGVFLGTGVGLIFRGGGSSGGWSILVRLISDKTHIGIGQVAIILDSTVVLMSAAYFRDYEAALLGGITVFVTGKLIDVILTQQPGSRLVHVSSHSSRELQAVVDTRFGICGTLIPGDAKKDQKSKDLLYLSIDRRQLKTLIDVIKEHAPDAQVTVADAVDIMGRH